MRCFLPILTVLILISTAAFADILECKGNVDLWIRKKSGWQKSHLKQSGYLEASSAEVGAVQVGTYLKFPSVIVYPFFGIKAEIKSKTIKFLSDSQTYFTLNGDGKKLHCEVKTEASP